jgi:predicted signal transduction protein with EAL and GGDEF domain
MAIATIVTGMISADSFVRARCPMPYASISYTLIYTFAAEGALWLTGQRASLGVALLVCIYLPMVLISSLSAWRKATELIAARARSERQEQFLAMRLGGDEFAIALGSSEGVAAIAALAREVVSSLSDPSIIADRQFRVSASVGFTMRGETRCRLDDRHLHVRSQGVNVSASQLRFGDYLKSLKDVLRESGTQPGKLELELTESVLIEDAEKAVIILKNIHSTGVRLALDDIGTGYSSLSYLRRFPFDTLNRPFFRHRVTDQDRCQSHRQNDY